MRVYVATPPDNPRLSDVLGHLVEKGHTVDARSADVPQQHSTVRSLYHDIGTRTFGQEMRALEMADACVLLTGRGEGWLTPGLQAGWARGAGKLVIAFLEKEHGALDTMLRMAHTVTDSLTVLDRALEDPGALLHRDDGETETRCGQIVQALIGLGYYTAGDQLLLDRMPLARLEAISIELLESKRQRASEPAPEPAISAAQAEQMRVDWRNYDALRQDVEKLSLFFRDHYQREIRAGEPQHKGSVVDAAIFYLQRERSMKS